MRAAVLVLALLAMAPAPWMPRFEHRALYYLVPGVQPTPISYDGSTAPNFEDFTFREQRCWGVKGCCVLCLLQSPTALLGTIRRALPLEQDPMPLGVRRSLRREVGRGLQPVHAPRSRGVNGENS